MKYIATILASVAVAVGGATILPAAAKQAAPSAVTVNNVAPITCRYEDSCVLDYRSGAWYARQATGTIWVRLTLVNGQ